MNSKYQAQVMTGDLFIKMGLTGNPVKSKSNSIVAYFNGTGVVFPVNGNIIKARQVLNSYNCGCHGTIDECYNDMVTMEKTLHDICGDDEINHKFLVAASIKLGFDSSTQFCLKWGSRVNYLFESGRILNDNNYGFQEVPDEILENYIDTEPDNNVDDVEELPMDRPEPVPIEVLEDLISKIDTTVVEIKTKAELKKEGTRSANKSKQAKDAYKKEFARHAMECEKIKAEQERKKQQLKKAKAKAKEQPKQSNDEENMCLICFKQVSLHAQAIKCKTCKKIMCFECCCNYSLANKFECESDETGYGVDVKIPCPVCKTINIFDI